MANKYGVVRTDRMHGTDGAPDLISAMYVPSNVETAIENGSVIKTEGLLSKTVDGVTTYEREIYKGVTTAANSAIDDVALVASVELMYKDEERSLDEFRNEAGKILRCYRLHKHDIFSVTLEGLDYTGTIVPGWVAFLAAQPKMKVAASAAGGATTIGVVRAVETVGPYTYVVIEVA